MNKSVIFGIFFAFLANAVGPMAKADEIILPTPGHMVSLSPAYNPAVIKGIKLDPNNPFRFHFFVDSGDDTSANLKAESSKLIKYFLASLTIPEKDLWVNLSPYEKDRIVPQEFGQTEMGRDLLAQDYILKQVTASLIYPESKLGKEFWQKVYTQAQAKYGTKDISINTFNKVWIVPDKAVVYENEGVAFVLENHLKVMLEEDYLSLKKHEGVKSIQAKGTNQIGNQIVREIVIPALTKEVNEGKNFSQLRQAFYSLILATWYKNKIKNSMFNKVYSNQHKIDGVNVSAGDKDRIYQEYLKAFKKGVYSYIKEEKDTTSQIVPKKYFSGGVIGVHMDAAMIIKGPNQVDMATIAQSLRTPLIDVFGEAMLESKLSTDGAMTVDRMLQGMLVPGAIDGQSRFIFTNYQTCLRRVLDALFKSGNNYLASIRLFLEENVNAIQVDFLGRSNSIFYDARTRTLWISHKNPIEYSFYAKPGNTYYMALFILREFFAAMPDISKSEFETLQDKNFFVNELGFSMPDANAGGAEAKSKAIGKARKSGKDYYAILEIDDPTVDQDTIKKAYRRLAIKYHPDKNQGSKEAKEKFQELGEAYEVLGKEDTRALYDESGVEGLVRKKREDRRQERARGEDYAMAVRSQPNNHLNNGGIDFNPTQMAIQVKKNGQDFKFNVNGVPIDAAQVTGATFNIRTMLPVTNLSSILGLSESSPIQ